MRRHKIPPAPQPVVRDREVEKKQVEEVVQSLSEKPPPETLLTPPERIAVPFPEITPADHSFFHSGDLGDVIYALSVIADLGGGSLYLDSRPWTQPMDEKRFNTLAPLINAQPYIKVCKMHDGEPISHDFSDFRSKLLSNKTLAETQARFIGANPDSGLKQWLWAKPKFHDRIIIHRSPRYHNDGFPWLGIIKYFGSKLLYCGVPDEHEMFVKDFAGVELHTPDDYLELSELIAGSSLFIGNQSSPFSIAEGLKHNVVQETYAHVPDCVFIRSNAMHVREEAIYWNGQVITNPPCFFSSENAGMPIKVNQHHFVRFTRTSDIGGTWSGLYKTSNSGEITAIRGVGRGIIQELNEVQYKAMGGK